jgi:hypothetical protein
VLVMASWLALAPPAGATVALHPSARHLSVSENKGFMMMGTGTASSDRGGSVYLTVGSGDNCGMGGGSSPPAPPRSLLAGCHGSLPALVQRSGAILLRSSSIAAGCVRHCLSALALQSVGSSGAIYIGTGKTTEGAAPARHVISLWALWQR